MKTMLLTCCKSRPAPLLCPTTHLPPLVTGDVASYCPGSQTPERCDPRGRWTGYTDGVYRSIQILTWGVLFFVCSILDNSSKYPCHSGRKHHTRPDDPIRMNTNNVGRSQVCTLLENLELRRLQASRHWYAFVRCTVVLATSRRKRCTFCVAVRYFSTRIRIGMSCATSMHRRRRYRLVFALRLRTTRAAHSLFNLGCASEC